MANSLSLLALACLADAPRVLCCVSYANLQSQVRHRWCVVNFGYKTHMVKEKICDASLSLGTTPIWYLVQLVSNWTQTPVSWVKVMCVWPSTQPQTSPLLALSWENVLSYVIWNWPGLLKSVCVSVCISVTEISWALKPHPCSCTWVSAVYIVIQKLLIMNKACVQIGQLWHCTFLSPQQ